MTVFKVAVGIASQSVGVLSEGIHSFLDLVSAAVAFFTIRAAGKPADDNHPYGHGKIETLSSLLESVLLDRKSTRLNSSHVSESRMPSSA